MLRLRGLYRTYANGCSSSTSERPCEAYYSNDENLRDEDNEEMRHLRRSYGRFSIYVHMSQTCEAEPSMTKTWNISCMPNQRVRGTMSSRPKKIVPTV